MIGYRKLGPPARNPNTLLSRGSLGQGSGDQRYSKGWGWGWGGCSQDSRVSLGGDGVWDMPPGYARA